MSLTPFKTAGISTVSTIPNSPSMPEIALDANHENGTEKRHESTGDITKLGEGNTDEMVSCFTSGK